MYKNPRGFISLNVVLVIIAVIVAGGAAWYALRKGLIPGQVALEATHFTIEDINASKNTQISLCTMPYENEDDLPDTVFLACPAHYKKTLGQFAVDFAAHVVRPSGEEREAYVFILFGDGEEENVASWKPGYSNEQMYHVYTQPGDYIASLVLVPKALLTEDVSQRRAKLGNLAGTKLIKKINIGISPSGAITIRQ